MARKRVRHLIICFRGRTLGRMSGRYVKDSERSSYVQSGVKRQRAGPSARASRRWTRAGFRGACLHLPAWLAGIAFGVATLRPNGKYPHRSSLLPLVSMAKLFEA
jgi:hypothetical protein